MSFLGTYLTLWIGPNIPVPALPTMMESLHSVQVTHNDTGSSGFQITFRVGRSGTDVLDYAMLANPALQPFSRVVLIVTFNAVPQVLMDGVVTQQELNPGTEPGTSTLTLTGEDLSVLMDLEERSAEHPGQDETMIALKLIGSYAQYGLIPLVIPPVVIDPPIPTERIPVQQGTDLQYLREMAERHAYTFYVRPGPAPLMNTAYWGPPERLSFPQKALNVNMGLATNVSNISFSYNALAPTTVEGSVQDRNFNQDIPVQTFASLRPPLALLPAWLTQSRTRTTRFRDSGLNTAQAYGRAQAETDASNDRVLTANGSLDALKYEGLLQPRGIVGLRGAGFNHDGLYYVRSVTHQISPGAYTQQFNLTRGGFGSITPLLR